MLLKNDFALDKYDKIVEIIEELKDYTIFHFKSEEEYMESINYKRLFTQKIEHAEFIKKLDAIDLKNVDENQDESLVEMLNFLNDWLTQHILRNEKLIRSIKLIYILSVTTHLISCILLVIKLKKIYCKVYPKHI